MAEKYLPIGELTMNSSFRIWRDRINALLSRVDDIKVLTGEDSVTGDDDGIIRAGDVRKLIIAMNLILE